MRRTRHAARARTGVVALAVGAVLLAGCAAAEAPVAPTVTVTPSPTSSRTAPPSPTQAPDPYPPGPDLPPATATPTDVATGLAAPWDLAFLPSGAVLVTLRDAAQVVAVTAAGVVPVTGEGAAQLADTVVDREAGLLGIAVSPGFADDRLVYLYRTTTDGNQVVRAELTPDLTLGPLQPVVSSVPWNWFHDGGRIAFGPDGYLYVGTGDAGEKPLAQDPGSLAGKILRVTPEGAPAPGNPVEGSPVWTLGHRNVQGLGWTSTGTMIASEFGQNAWDELNVITPGADYGWPRVEGSGGGAGLTDPVVTWSTDEASPSGIAVGDTAVWVAALRGERLWRVPLAADGSVGTPEVAVDGLGRLRTVALGPDGALWILTNNTDGRGSPRPGDDRLLRVAP